MLRAALCLTVMTACSSSAEPPGRVLPAIVHDAGLPPDDADLSVDPLASDPPIGRAPGRTVARVARPIDVILRSSPSGAMVAVDGVQLGTTPTYWAGDANGRDHEFLFVRKGYAYARYRFVPITSGVVHARLEPIAEDSPAAMPPELFHTPEPPPPPAPLARRPSPPPPPPPDAAVSPPDAAPAEPEAEPPSPPGAGPAP